MAKQKKNSNYQTERTAAAQAEREAEKLKEKRDKTIKTALISTGASVGVIAIIFIILFACGAFNYHPEPTYHATVNISGHDSLHIELYGNDAPETVKHFIDLCEDGFFEGKNLHTFVDGMLYGGSRIPDGGITGLKGEFASNGFDNKILMEKGVVAMARGDDKDSAYGQFFILTENSKDLFGEYAAFGRITDMDALEAILKEITTDENGKIEDAPIITSISLHEAHH